MEVCQFCKKVCLGDRGFSLHRYHNKECFQKLTDISKNYNKFTLAHTQEQESSLHKMLGLKKTKKIKSRN